MSQKDYNCIPSALSPKLSKQTPFFHWVQDSIGCGKITASKFPNNWKAESRKTSYVKFSGLLKVSEYLQVAFDL